MGDVNNIQRKQNIGNIMSKFAVITFIPIQMTTFSIIAFKILKVYCIYHNDNSLAADNKPKRITCHKKESVFAVIIVKRGKQECQFWNWILEFLFKGGG